MLERVREHALRARARVSGWRSASRSLAAALAVAWPALPAAAFGFPDVVQRAQTLSQSPYKAPVDKLAPELRDLSYDGYRDIRFKPDSAMWRKEKLPFELMFFHAGRGFAQPVRIHEVIGGRARPVSFDPGLFDYGANRLDPAALRDAGYAGFRVHFPVNNVRYKDEALVFLGASYFRAVGRDQVYGLSARGLAVDTASPQGEEFPRFTEFWIERPSANATTLVIHALLDSPKVAGAYRFELKPALPAPTANAARPAKATVASAMDQSATTQVAVTARLFPRNAIGKLGMAPLTSMFLFGENQPGRDDYRPEVHDSDGLSIATGNGEWIWRPLVNPQRLLVTSFATRDPKGFGLMQRDRAYGNYEDPEALYHRRPSLWIEPQGAWGEGRVELVQIPTPDETNDNIVAYWVPDRAPEAGKPIEFAYRMLWQKDNEIKPPLAWVVQTRRGRGFVNKPDGHLKFVVDFEGPALTSLPANVSPEAVVWVGNNAELMERNLFRDPVSLRWRMTVRVKRTDIEKPVEMRAYLSRDRAQISETWSYIVPPRPESKP
jgi:periplasmic glucans biosynthesis protein